VNSPAISNGRGHVAGVSVVWSADSGDDTVAGGSGNDVITGGLGRLSE